MPYNTSLNLTRYVGASRLVARRLALRYANNQSPIGATYAKDIRVLGNSSVLL